ncbi:hypothetical protein [Nocardia wallacei]|uniref:hypothetical protein n=1 Tax=Nocardia wallacei TaxID=480035 RepID=UPI00245777CC|nr:hypothetical protein [Nocardia wallacei]
MSALGAFFAEARFSAVAAVTDGTVGAARGEGSRSSALRAPSAVALGAQTTAPALFAHAVEATIGAAAAGAAEQCDRLPEAGGVQQLQHPRQWCRALRCRRSQSGRILCEVIGQPPGTARAPALRLLQDRLGVFGAERGPGDGLQRTDEAGPDNGELVAGGRQLLLGPRHR